MAHNIQAYPQPREQLRTEAPRQRPHNDKYVTVFQSSIAHVDMTFRDPVLTESADHFAVGVDELTVSLGSLSMIEYNATRPTVLLRVRLRGVDAAVDARAGMNYLMVDGPAGNLTQWRDAFEFKVDRPYTNLQEILARMNAIAGVVTSYIQTYGLQNGGGGFYTAAYQVAAGGNAVHLKITLSENGNLVFRGTRAFWANFVIEVPERRYQQIFFGKDKQYVSLHPITGAVVEEPYNVVGPQLETIALDPVLSAADILTVVHIFAAINNDHIYAGDANLMNTIDRRVTIEVSCSLPIKNSPMVDHGKESPDFALARYLFHRRYSLETGDDTQLMRIATHDLGAKTLQGPRDRVSYHHLRPQQKIQTLRLRLWARVRTYDANTNVWGMKTIICPIENSDFWHCRLHFKHHDS